ncbi:MAG: fibronectin type III domain-containing protein, partial [Thermoguttaceae bacterium]|nr:fibronectin type III domain-containing protein [Thermoguttaceae bacterium]
MSDSSNKKGFSRRLFMGLLSAGGLGSFWGHAQAGAAEKPQEIAEVQLDDSVDSFPMLQNPTPQSMNVVWAMKCPGTGYVEWGTSDKLGNVARTCRLGLYAYDERIMTAEIEDLKPNTQYFYRTVTIGMKFPRYARIVAGSPVYSKIYSFVTPGPKAPQTTFAMINDTHERQSSLKILAAKLLELKADYTIWN